MTSNVVTFPGIGHGAQPPVRPVAPAPSNDQNPRPKFSTDDTDDRRGGDGRNGESRSAQGRPQSPVALNSLIAAQEHGGNTSESSASQGSGPSGQLTEEEQKYLAELKKNDAEVRRHEQAHASVGGQYAGAPQYEFTTGPDGKQYAHAGHVKIDVTPIPNDPQATIQKMDVVRRAALAPAEPSGADRSVAAKASAERQKAQAELAEVKAEALANPGGEGATNGVVGNTGLAGANEAAPDNAAKAGNSISHAAAAAAYAAPLNAISGSASI